MNQLAMMGLLPSPAATGTTPWHAVWPLVLLVVLLFAVLPLTRVYGNGPGQPGSKPPTRR